MRWGGPTVRDSATDEVAGPIPAAESLFFVTGITPVAFRRQVTIIFPIFPAL